MDPASIVQLVGTAVSLGDVVISCIKRLHSLKAKYHDAPLVIATITGQLYMVQAALDQLKIWNKPEYERNPRYQQLALQIDNFLDGFGLLILTLERRLEDFELNGSKTITAKQKVMFLWGEKDTSEYSALLDRQVNALNLLLQAVQCNTWAQQQDMIGREENQYILQQAKDFSSSIIGLEDSASFISEDTAGISIMFDFDAVLLTSRIYQQVGRSHLRQAIKVGRRPLSFEQAHKEKRSKNSSKITVIQPAGPSFRASLNGPPESSRHQAQGDTVTANMARTLSPLTRPRAQNTDDFLPDDTLEHEKSGRTLPSQQLPKAAWLPNQTIQSKSDTNSRQEQDVLGGQRSHNSKRNVLILGTSESGKSTLLKGLKLTLSEDYTTEERLLYESLIRNNLLRSIQNVVKAMDSLEIPLGDERNEWHMQTIQLTHSVTRTWKDIGRAVSALWLDSGFYTAYERRHEYELDDNTLYYAAAVERLSEANYVPTNLDILWHRKRTSSPSGIQLLDKDYVGGAYRFVDVGGSRPQRKKWIQSFANISTVLFTIDTTSYARRLAEDKRVNRMQDQLKTFKAVGNSWWFTNSNFILLFTKMDQLEDWLAREPPKRYFPGFTDPSSQPLVEHYMQYLEELFISTIPSKKIRSRIQTIRVNLLDIENEKPLMKVVEMLDYLSMMYPEMSGYSEAEWHMV